AAGRPREFLDLFLRRWDLNSVKSLLRVRHQGLDLDEALGALAPGAHMPPGVQRRLAQCETVEALCGQLIVWDSELCGGLSAALPAYSATRDLALLDEALDRHYFVRGAARLKDAEDQDSRLLHFFFQLEIDRINLRLIFERLREPAPVPASMDRLLPEGTLAPALLRRLIEADDAAQAAEMLGGTRYRDFLEELYQFMQTHRFSPVERLFEQALLRELRRLAVRDPLGLAVAMDYSWRKYNEGINLRLIARGLAGHLPSGRVREELVFV
ncbi:MAG TPA: V-type ATPase subunit, partial [Candidatus Hydrogenedentes bacterium]|nr:V-type ATPase subunit [Candidatus Hydrogenedentota bacterium]